MKITATETEMINFMMELATAYREELLDHGYRPPPFEIDGVCCSLPMMYRAFERIGMLNFEEANWKIDFAPGAPLLEIVKE